MGLLGLGSMVVAGGLAGVCYWLPIYPADIVKSRLQIDSFTHPAYRSTWDCVLQVPARLLPLGLWLSIAALHSFVCFAPSCFAVVQLTSAALSA